MKDRNDRKRIFSGGYSQDMWDELNEARSKKDLRRALFTICCRLQELESYIEEKFNEKA